MKRKFLFTLTSVLLCATLFTACTNTNSKAKFYGYWNYDAEIAAEGEETLVYTVTSDTNEPLKGISSDYTVQYTQGIYTTVLKTETVEGKAVYRYETNFSINVTFEYGGETVTHTDETKTWVQFEKSSEVYFRPIASHKEFVSHSPSNTSAGSLESCYQKFEYSVDIKYNGDVTKGETTVKTGATETSRSFGIDTKKYTYIDPEQLYFSVRGINPTGAAVNTTLLNYNPFTETVQEVKVSFGTADADAFQFSKDGGEAKAHQIAYYPVTLSVNEKNPGPSKTLWVAKCENAKTNEYRNVILQMETPLAYGMGSLIYKLTSANFSK